MKKVLIITTILIFITLTGFSCNKKQERQNPQNLQNTQNTQNLNDLVNKEIGGERDSHGCLGPAGYTWCESKQKCLRSWEEDCPLN